MKRVFIAGIAVFVGFGLCVGLVILAITGIFAVTRPVVNASEQFLSLLGQGKVAEAYASTADGLRAQQDVASFSSAVKQLGLTDYSSVSWSHREINNQEGTAEGTVTARDGGTKAVFIRLVWEGDKWKVVGVRFGGVDLLTLQASSAVPPEAELARMVTETLLDFNQAVQEGDFTAFYGKLSDVWKRQTTPQQLQTIFHEFLEQRIDIGPIRDLMPQIAPSAVVNDNGVLVVAGKYPTQPSQVRFELQYTRERDRWKLMSISLGVGNDDVPVAAQ
jgi:hypothetical protein